MYRIILIGPRSVGKSTVGKIIAEKLKLKYFDLDGFVTERLGDIDEFISMHTLEEYRKQESHLLKELLGKLPREYVISIGGGTIASQFHGLSEINAELLKKKGTFVFINPSYDKKEGPKALFDKEKERKGNKSFSDIKKLFEIRQPIYEKYAEITVLTMNKSPEQVAGEIITRFK